LITRYIAISLNFANAVENLNELIAIEQEFNTDDKSKSNQEWKYLVSTITTFKKIVLKFICDYHKKFKSMKQYEDLSPNSLLSVDNYLELRKANMKRKSPYEAPGKKKVNPTAINSNMLHVNRITKDDTFVKQLNEIFDDLHYKNYKID